ncbi:LamG-like jellyroll fold domain-containing protein [Marinilabilia sp.]
MKLKTIIIVIFTYFSLALNVVQGQTHRPPLIEISQPLIEVHSGDNIQALIKSGIRAFCPVPYPSGSGNALNKTFRDILEGFNKSQAGTILLINNHFASREWDQALQKSGIAQVVLKPDTYKNLPPSEIPVPKKGIVSFNATASVLSFNKNDFIANFSRNDSILSEEELTRDLLMVNYNVLPADTIESLFFRNWLRSNANNHIQSTSSLLNLWKTTGKRPHFILTTPNKAKEVKEITDPLNKMPFYRARVLNKRRPYAPVFSDNDPDFRGGGRISFPSPPGHRVIFSPRTRGLRFSPDILIFTPENQNREITFRGFPLSPADDRVVWFHFNNEHAPASPEVKNLIHPSDSLMVSDPERGRVFQFNGHEDYLDCGSSLDIDFNQPISIAAWVKPEKTDLNRGIAGMGRSFSFKIHEGQLTFTTADIKDHRLANGRIIPNKWQHVAVVFEPRMKISLYLNGKKMESQQASDIQASDHSIIIGSNIWGEYFDGYIDDLMIWNRALADEEVAALVTSEKQINSVVPQPKTNSGKNTLRVILIFISGVILFFLFYWFRKKAITKKNTSTPHDEQHESELPSTTKLCTFGGFRIVTPDGKDLAARFSPREKQLFVYLLWHSLRSPDKGVSSKQLSNDLWPGMSAARAKNNRSTYVQHLRQNLEGTGMAIQYSSDRKWKLSLPQANKLFCDLYEYMKAINKYNQSPSAQNLKTLTTLLEAGPFLKDAENETMDHFKSEIENEIIQVLTTDQTIETAINSKSLVPALLNVMRQYDPLNEIALSLEIKWLTQSGHHGRALDAFRRFNRDYKNYYGENFSKEMSEFC